MDDTPVRLIRLTTTDAGGRSTPVLINPRYVKRVKQVQDKTVIEMADSEYATWADESVDEVVEMLDAETVERY